MTRAQHWEATDDYSGRGADITGEKFGELTAIRMVSRRSHGNVWLLRCECGRLATFTVAYLRSYVKGGGTPCCSECQSELRRGRWLAIRSYVVDARVRQFLDTGTLWTMSEIESLTYQIRESLSRQLGVEIETEETPTIPLIVRDTPLAYGTRLDDGVDDEACDDEIEEFKRIARFGISVGIAEDAFARR